ncbi:MAG: MFS transporter [Gammaproteobacteria bacterium]
MIAGYFGFAAANLRFVGFGFFLAFTSSYGQTYFIGVFGPHVETEFDLSHTAWGTVYMVGTLGSAAVLPWTGKLIDRLDLRTYTVGVFVLFAAAAAVMAGATGALTLTLAIFALRHGGQGLMSHTAVTSMTRYFAAARGRAVAIATLGFSLAEAVLPLGAVLLVAVIGWRASYGLIGTALLCVMLPIALWLLTGHSKRHQQYSLRLEQSKASSGTPAGPDSWTIKEMLRDPRFHLLMPGLAAPSVIVTAMFFHHLTLADAKGWTHVWFAGSYFVYALASTLASLASGPVIDRYGAIRLVRYMLVPLALALLALVVSDTRAAAWIYLALAGVNVGIAHTAVSVMWAELYGIAHLGGIKALAGAISVFASALGPVSAGALMDHGLSIEQVCAGFVAYIVLAQPFIMLGLRRARRA